MPPLHLRRYPISLQSRAEGRRPQTFDGQNFLPRGLGHTRHAGTGKLAADHHATGAAVTRIAACLGSGLTELQLQLGQAGSAVGRADPD